MAVDVDERRQHHLGIARIAIANNDETTGRDSLGLCEVAPHVGVGQGGGQQRLDRIEHLFALAAHGASPTVTDSMKANDRTVRTIAISRSIMSISSDWR